jgi:hypothetical protein
MVKRRQLPLSISSTINRHYGGRRLEFDDQGREHRERPTPSMPRLQWLDRPLIVDDSEPNPHS